MSVLRFPEREFTVALVVLREPDREFTVVVRFVRLVLVVLREPERFATVALVVLREPDREFTTHERVLRLFESVRIFPVAVARYDSRFITTPERTEKLLFVMARAHERTEKFETMTPERVVILRVFCAVVQERVFTVVTRFERFVFVVAITPERAPISPVF